MVKNKNNKAIWNSRIKVNSSSLFQRVGSSIDIDKRLYKEDIMASITHVEMLFKQKIISFMIKNKIIYGLGKIEKEISKNKFQFDKKYEDIHMNIEKRLFEIIGEEAGYIHTARSRNDQVLTDFKIWMRSASKEINNNLDKLIPRPCSDTLRTCRNRRRYEFGNNRMFSRSAQSLFTRK